jgi:hypothetical protein
MLRKNLIIACVLFLLCAAPSLLAQRGGRPGGPPGDWGRPGGPPDKRRGGPPEDVGRPRPPGEPGRRPGGPGGADFFAVETRFDPKVVKDLPYSAQASIEHTRTLGDGTRIQRRDTITVYRDSAGRTRREQTIKGIGPIDLAGEPIMLVFISDPVAGANYVLNQGLKLVRKVPFGGPGGPPPGAPKENGEAENLGKQTMEGIEVEGTRLTFTIPAGQFGNDRPVKVVSERWYSPALQVTVMSRHSDPRTGESVYRLTDIKRAEPARVLFEIPADYRQEKDGRPGHRRPE